VDGGMVVGWAIMGFAALVVLFWGVLLIWAFIKFRNIGDNIPSLKAESDAYWNIRFK